MVGPCVIFLCLPSVCVCAGRSIYVCLNSDKYMSNLGYIQKIKSMGVLQFEFYVVKGGATNRDMSLIETC